MPAIDQCHDQITRALRKAGWTVDAKPYVLRLTSGRRLFVDIKAQYEQNEIIVVEVKCFVDNQVEELYTAIGQYLVYRNVLQRLKIHRPIYLALPVTAYYGIVDELAIEIIQEAKIKLIVVDIKNEVIEQWKE